MKLFPAIDLYDGKAVRLFKGDYNQMTIYSDHPEQIGLDFAQSGCRAVHIVDLEGAKYGTTPNLQTVLRIQKECGLFCEIGGGIRNMDTVDRYLGSGLDRVILGTAAVKDPHFLEVAVNKYGSQITVGVDLLDGYVAVKGWTERSDLEAFAFCQRLQTLGVRHIICTDISKDGAMMGTNHQLYKDLSQQFRLDITASGGVSSLEDIQKLAALDLYGAIIGKAYYTGAIDLQQAVALAGKQ